MTTLVISALIALCGIAVIVGYAALCAAGDADEDAEKYPPFEVGP